MFEKLLAVLPYNPSLVNQLSFYSRRMKQESTVRRTGIIFLLLAFFIQFFAVISPPQATVANSSNDLINGGISSAASAAGYCRNNTAGYGDIMKNYGISCDAIAGATTVNLKSTDFNKQLYSMGRLPYGKQGETPVQIASTTYYMRYLWAWDSGASSSYQALKLTVNGVTYYILYNCGNLTTIGLPKPVPPPAPCPYNPNLPAGDAGCYQPCQYDAGIPASDSRCHPAPCPLDSSIYVTDTRCKVCPYDSSITKTNKLCVKCVNPRYPTSSASSSVCKPVCPYDQSIDKNNPSCKVCPYNGNILQNNVNCKPCDKSVSSADALACLSVHKTAANLTQSLADANNTMAHAGDTIVYTLYAQNTGKSTIKGFVFQENLNDVLDYADVVDLYGGSRDKNNIISWPAQDIAANTTAVQRVSVKVKTPIPETPVASSDGGHFNLAMANVYGNTINITLPTTPVKTVETVAASLPNTGPGTSLTIMASVVILAGYFFARARLLANEAAIAIKDNNSGGF